MVQSSLGDCSRIANASAVAIVERGRGQPGIVGLANLRLQLTAAGAIMTAAAAEAAR